MDLIFESVMGTAGGAAGVVAGAGVWLRAVPSNAKDHTIAIAIIVVFFIFASSPLLISSSLPNGVLQIGPVQDTEDPYQADRDSDQYHPKPSTRAGGGSKARHRDQKAHERSRDSRQFHCVLPLIDFFAGYLSVSSQGLHFRKRQIDAPSDTRKSRISRTLPPVNIALPKKANARRNRKTATPCVEFAPIISSRPKD
jgi:hypothetical protein